MIHKYLIVSFSLLIVINVSLKSQELKFDGYFENQLYPQMINSKLTLHDYNKLRIDLSSDIDDNITFNGNYIYKTYHGKTNLTAFDFIPNDVIKRYSSNIGLGIDTLRTFFEEEQKDENFLDNAYLTFYLSYVNIRIGKQQLPWGSGYTWNPTDIFNDKDFLDPTYEKPGVNALKVEIPFSLSGIIQLVYTVGEDWQASTKAVKIKDHFSGFDVAAMYVEKEETQTNYYTFRDQTEKRKLIGSNLSGQLFGVGVWFEVAYNLMESSKDFGQYLVGADYTFESELYLIAEYYRNGLGKTDEKKYSFEDWMSLINPSGINLGKDYLFAGNKYPVTELISWANYVLININDKSGMIYPWLEINLTNNTDLTLVGYIPFGKSQTEFGEFGEGGFARVRVYF
ncbi:MAG: hypothetical protein PVH88_10970 [Ignavibacteria bacterium]|jgi:hypothetical protein